MIAGWRLARAHKAGANLDYNWQLVTESNDL